MSKIFLDTFKNKNREIQLLGIDYRLIVRADDQAPGPYIGNRVPYIHMYFVTLL